MLGPVSWPPPYTLLSIGWGRQPPACPFCPRALTRPSGLPGNHQPVPVLPPLRWGPGLQAGFTFVHVYTVHSGLSLNLTGISVSCFLDSFQGMTARRKQQETDETEHNRSKSLPYSNVIYCAVQGFLKKNMPSSLLGTFLV